MSKAIVALISGFIFGIGLVISQMINPAKVLGFLDLFGAWDPSLIFVMASGLVVFGAGYWLFHKRKKSLLGLTVSLPSMRKIDLRLLVGAGLFGAGWGVVGLCPGPALSATLIGGAEIWIFLAALLAGMVANYFLDRFLSKD